MFSDREYWAEIFSGMDASEHSFSSIEFDDCTFRGCDFRESLFRHCRFIDCRFIECDMNVADFSGTRFEETRFEQCKLNGVDWTKADYSEFIQEAPFSFYESVLDYSSFFGAKLENLCLKNCRLIEVDFRESDLAGSNFFGSDLRESQFRNTNLSNCDFREAYNYTIDIRINTITGAKFSRDEAVSLLQSLDIVLE